MEYLHSCFQLKPGTCGQKNTPMIETQTHGFIGFLKKGKHLENFEIPRITSFVIDESMEVAKTDFSSSMPLRYASNFIKNC